MPAEFDRYGSRYRERVQRSVAFAGRDVDFYLAAKARHLLSLARRHVGPPEMLRVLDVGCGAGLFDRLVASALGELHGIDPSEALLRDAARANPGVRYHAADGTALPFADGSFDVVFATCVLHHIPVANRAGVVREMVRVARAGGLVVVMEHNPWNPLTRLAVRLCEFDRGVVLLGRGATRRLLCAAGAPSTEERYILFFPLAFGWVERAEAALRGLPLGAQYVVAGRKPGRRRDAG